MRSRVYLAVLFVVASCGGDDEYCVEARLDISQGLYGRVTYQTDVSPDTNPPVPVGDEPIDVLDGPMGSIVASTTSGSDGVFQVALDVGGYALCGPASPPTLCVTFTVTSGTRVREDLYKGFGTAWQATPRSDCAE